MTTEVTPAGDVIIASSLSYKVRTEYINIKN